MRPPWFFCNGWWSPWCLIDAIAHSWFNLSFHGEHWVCRKHDKSLLRW